MTTQTVFVAGATGATGKIVVRMLLDKGHTVKTVVRSKDRLFRALLATPGEPSFPDDRLFVTEASILDMSDSDLQEQVDACHAVVSCLGHNMTFQGAYGHPRRLVTDAVKRLTNAMSKSKSAKKFILMSGESVANPDGQEATKPLLERSILSFVKFVMPPFSDSEIAVGYLHSLGTETSLEWCVVRPAKLVNGEVSAYELFDTPPGSMFDGNKSTRANVADVMVALVLDNEKWKEWKFKMPILHDSPVTTTAQTD